MSLHPAPRKPQVSAPEGAEGAARYTLSRDVQGKGCSDLHPLHPAASDHLERALDSAASETDAEALARELARAGITEMKTTATTTMLTVTLERDLVLDLLAIARRGVRSDDDAEVLGEVQLVARTEGGH